MLRDPVPSQLPISDRSLLGAGEGAGRQSACVRSGGLENEPLGRRGGAKVLVETVKDGEVGYQPSSQDRRCELDSIAGGQRVTIEKQDRFIQDVLPQPNDSEVDACRSLSPAEVVFEGCD